MKTKVKHKTCKVCKEKFELINSMQKVCNYKCGLRLADLDKRKKYRKDLISYRKENKKLSDHVKEAQVSFNAYVRVRDYHDPCISSGKPETYGANEFDCGHYRSVGSAPHLRFNLHNAHKQHKHDNNFLSGNIVEYRPRLLAKIGLDKLEALETNNEYRKYTKEYCERVKRIFNKKTRMRKKRLGIS